MVVGKDIAEIAVTKACVYFTVVVRPESVVKSRDGFHVHKHFLMRANQCGTRRPVWSLEGLQQEFLPLVFLSAGIVTASASARRIDGLDDGRCRDSARHSGWAWSRFSRPARVGGVDKPLAMEVVVNAEDGTRAVSVPFGEFGSCAQCRLRPVGGPYQGVTSTRRRANFFASVACGRVSVTVSWSPWLVTTIPASEDAVSAPT